MLKAAIHNSFSIVIRLLTSLGVIKIMALCIGPSGLALVGNMRSFVELAEGLSTLGIRKGVVRYIAELQSDTKELYSFIATVAVFGMAFCVLISLLIICFAPSIALYLFDQFPLDFVIYLVAASLPFFFLHTLFLDYLTAIGAYEKVVTLNIISYLVYFGLTSLLTVIFGATGALVAISINSICLFISTLPFFRIGGFKKLLKFPVRIKERYLHKLKGYLIMRAGGALLVPLAILLIRNFAITRLGEFQTGLIEAVWRISGNYLFFALSLITIYIYPKLSTDLSWSNFQKISFEFYSWLAPFFILGLFTIFLLRDWLLKLLFSDEFEGATGLFLWQLTGDLFRFFGLVMVAMLNARRLVGLYIFSEALLACVLYLSTILLFDRLQLEAVVLSHAIAYMIQFVMLYMIFRYYLKIKLV